MSWYSCKWERPRMTSLPRCHAHPIAHFQPKRIRHRVSPLRGEERRQLGIPKGHPHTYARCLDFTHLPRTTDQPPPLVLRTPMRETLCHVLGHVPSEPASTLYRLNTGVTKAIWQLYPRARPMAHIVVEFARSSTVSTSVRKEASWHPVLRQRCLGAHGSLALSRASKS